MTTDHQARQQLSRRLALGNGRATLELTVLAPGPSMALSLQPLLGRLENFIADDSQFRPFREPTLLLFGRLQLLLGRPRQRVTARLRAPPSHSPLNFGFAKMFRTVPARQVGVDER